MDELFVLVYFLIILNLFVIIFLGYNECNNQKRSFRQEDIGYEITDTYFKDSRGMETDNIFTRNR
jgi:hypothetical protein